MYKYDCMRAFAVCMSAVFVMYKVPKISTKGYAGALSFLYVSATLWNELCDDRLTKASSVAVLKSRLKIHLFNSIQFFIRQ